VNESKEHLRRIEELDVSLFNAVPSMTSTDDRRSFLVVQRAIARKREGFAYLEIGSHLGGSIQPYLLDHRCSRVYSIDVRSAATPDDRLGVYVYDDNTTERMLQGLREFGGDTVEKIECFDGGASTIETSRIDAKPSIALIDGEHTKQAVLTDWEFCRDVVADDAIILFHDFSIIYPAILDICKELKRVNPKSITLKLDGDVFAVFLDPSIIESDPLLTDIYKRNRHYLIRMRLSRLKRAILSVTPQPLLSVYRTLRRLVIGSVAESSQ
jgi:hypothetical protein